VYFGELKNALTQMQTLAQSLNLAETGFCSRPENAMTKKIIYKNDCSVKSAFREQMDPNRVGLVATIALSGESLKPAFERGNRLAQLSECALMRSGRYRSAHRWSWSENRLSRSARIWKALALNLVQCSQGSRNPRFGKVL
jgi:hypothetical protein